MSSDILYKEESYRIIGSAMEVYNTLGRGFIELVYQEALEMEFRERNIPFIPQAPIEVYYKKQKLKRNFIADFFCFDDILVEIKAVSKILPEHEAQIINYLKATNIQLGLLINFGAEKLEYKRYLNIY
ncbi:MAG: GxxExxY protein [Prevotellaceae bacterium]|jgi:GxxExxY protein|nr:GxxExxY protein [Prevotellaceae bacterium]